MGIPRAVYVKHVTLVWDVIPCVPDMVIARMITVSVMKILDIKESSVIFQDVPGGLKTVLVMVLAT